MDIIRWQPFIFYRSGEKHSMIVVGSPSPSPRHGTAIIIYCTVVIYRRARTFTRSSAKSIMRSVLSSFVIRFIYIYIYGAIIGNMELRKGMIRICKLSYQVFRVLSKTFIIRLKRINFFSISPDLFEID